MNAEDIIFTLRHGKNCVHDVSYIYTQHTQFVAMIHVNTLSATNNAYVTPVN